jgi:hypothetical protein
MPKMRKVKVMCRFKFYKYASVNIGTEVSVCNADCRQVFGN